MKLLNQIRTTMGYVINLGIVTGVLLGSSQFDLVANAQTQTVLSSYQPLPDLEGQITITGSDTMAPLLNQLASEFGRLYGYPKVKVFVESTGSTLAIREFVIGFSQQRRGDKSREGHDAAGLASMLASSRALTGDERARFRSRYGYDPLEIPIAEDALAIYVHQDNPLQELSLKQLESIFRWQSSNEDVRTWGQVGLGGEWQEQPIHLHGRDKRSGTREFFIQYVLNEGEVKPELKEAPGSASEILAISRDPLAIGYAGTGFTGAYVKALAIATAKDQPGIRPTAETIANQTYPLRRTLYLYVNHNSDERFRQPLVREFLRFICSKEGNEVIRKGQFHPISKEQLQKNTTLINR